MGTSLEGRGPGHRGSASVHGAHKYLSAFAGGLRREFVAEPQQIRYRPFLPPGRFSPGRDGVISSENRVAERGRLCSSIQNPELRDMWCLPLFNPSNRNLSISRHSATMRPSSFPFCIVVRRVLARVMAHPNGPHLSDILRLYAGTPSAGNFIKCYRDACALACSSIPPYLQRPILDCRCTTIRLYRRSNFPNHQFIVVWVVLERPDGTTQHVGTIRVEPERMADRDRTREKSPSVHWSLSAMRSTLITVDDNRQPSLDKDDNIVYSYEFPTQPPVPLSHLVAAIDVIHQTNAFGSLRCYLHC